MEGVTPMATGSKIPDIFVSYAHVDNKPLPGVENGWVTELVRGIQIHLDQLMGRPENYSLWMDYALRGNQCITPEILTKLNSSRTLLMILSPGYLTSEWCQREMDAFLDRHGAGSDCIFAVEPMPTDIPGQLADFKGYRFYEESPEGKLTRFGWPAPDTSQRRYYERLDDLARDLAGCLQGATDESREEAGSDASPSDARTVFLAEAHPEEQSAYNSLRRFLKDESIGVLPAERYPPPPQLEKDLNASDLFILLLGREPNTWAGYYLEEARKHDLDLLLWHSPQLDIKDVKDDAQKKLLQRREVMVSDRVDLHNEIIRRLQPPEQEPFHKDVFLFVNHAPEDSPYVEAFTEHLESRRISYVLPMQEIKSVKDFQKDRENCLRRCEALVLLHFDAPKSWIREQLMLCRWIGGSRKKNMKGIGVCQEQITSTGINLPNLHQIPCIEKDPVYCLDTFLESVTA